MASPDRRGGSTVIAFVVGGLVIAVAVIALIMMTGDRGTPVTTAGDGRDVEATGTVTAPDRIGTGRTGEVAPPATVPAQPVPTAPRVPDPAAARP